MPTNKLNASQVKKWMADMQLAQELERHALKQTRPDAMWSIALSVSMIEAAGPQCPKTLDRLRKEDDDKARATWYKLRKGYNKKH